jgi:ribosome maturation factor RimP
LCTCFAVHRRGPRGEWAGGPLFVYAERPGEEKPSRGPHDQRNKPTPLARLGRGPEQLVDTHRIAQTIKPSLDAMGYRLVRVVITSGRRPTLQVMAERADDRPITLDDCVEISHSVSALLDVADPIASAYMLEVSSPGIDRPLVRLEDYDRFTGFEAKIELSRPIEGRRRFRGRLLGTAGGNVRLATERGETELPLDTVARARLVITDDLIAAAGPEAAINLQPPHPLNRPRIRPTSQS